MLGQGGSIKWGCQGRACEGGDGKDPEQVKEWIAGMSGWSSPLGGLRSEPARCENLEGHSVRNERGKRGGSGRVAEDKVSEGKDLGLIPKMKWEAIRGFGSDE